MKIRRKNLFTNYFIESENRQIDFLILHNIAAENLEKAIDLLKLHEVSAHYVIDINGDVHQLVEEKNIAFHAGTSYWSGVEGLNKNSIGIEFFNPDPDNLDFTDQQLEAGIKLSKDIKKRYNIKNCNIVGHLDVAFFSEIENFGYLGRKKDPSYRFDWQRFYDNNLGEKLNYKIFDLISSLSAVKRLKEGLANYGYKINKIDDNFDGQLQSVIDIIRYKYNFKLKMKVEIFQDTKNAMQSGFKKRECWFLKIVSENNLKRSDKSSLQGWNSSDNMYDQLKIKFYNREDAIKYANDNGYEYVIRESKCSKVRKKSYQSNFTNPIL